MGAALVGEHEPTIWSLACARGRSRSVSGIVWALDETLKRSLGCSARTGAGGFVYIHSYMARTGALPWLTAHPSGLSRALQQLLSSAAPHASGPNREKNVDTRNHRMLPCHCHTTADIVVDKATGLEVWWPGVQHAYVRTFSCDWWDGASQVRSWYVGGCSLKT